MKTALRRAVDSNANSLGYRLYLWCPGCEEAGLGGLHGIGVRGPDDVTPEPCWEWDGNRDEPTISPSILVSTTMAGKQYVCHSYVKAGVWQYLGDSTHPLAGTSAALEHLPDWASR